MRGMLVFFCVTLLTCRGDSLHEGPTTATQPHALLRLRDTHKREHGSRLEGAHTSHAVRAEHGCDSHWKQPPHQKFRKQQLFFLFS